jgi:hypothetical protein
MTIAFTNQVLCYCLGGGSLSLKGQRSRPWLELIRPELEVTYLRHQLRLLRESHSGDIRVVHDTLPGQEPYGRVRARLQSDSLWRAYELLCPYDRRKISANVLDVTGIEGFAALWADRGSRLPASARISLGRAWPSPGELVDWTTQLGHPAEVRTSSAGIRSLHWDREEAKALMEALRPRLHPSRRVSTWPKQTRQWSFRSARD